MHRPAQSAGNVLIYTNSDTERLHVQGRSKRSSTGTDTYTISSGLRALGDYLDKKRAISFEIAWSRRLVAVRLETVAGSAQHTSFTPQELQDLTVGMYLRRSDR